MIPPAEHHAWTLGCQTCQREAEERAERYRRALVAIANAESGIWGRVAFDALNPKEGDA